MVLLSTLRRLQIYGSVKMPVATCHHKAVWCSFLYPKQLAKSEYKSLKRVVIKSLGFRLGTRQFHVSCIRTNGPSTDNSNKNADRNSGDKKNRDDKKSQNEAKILPIVTKAIFAILTIYMFIAFFSLVTTRRSHQPEVATRYISWNEFVHNMLETGEVKEVIIRPDMEMVSIILHDGAVIKGKKVTSTLFYMAIADATKFEEKLRAVEKRLGISEGVTITYDRQSDIYGRVIALLLLFAVLVSLSSRIKNFKGPINMDSFTQMGRAKYTLIDPFEGGRGVLFRDVAGLKEAKLEVKEFVDYLKSPERYQILGAKVPKGALLLGPPGCGKTLLAKAVATEAHVPFLSMNGSEFIEMIGGLGAARVRDLFHEAKKKAPSIIYIDEIDAIGKRRSGAENMNHGSSGESEQTLNQLLVEMDGMATKAGVLMLASTNRADILDKALLRPGRFDRHILIDLPTLEERKEIFEKHLSGIKLDAKPTTYSQRLAKLTPGFSGADIANVCNEAALHAARNCQEKVTTNDLEYAVERLVGGTEKRSHALSFAERRVIAYHESGHALVGWLLPNADVLLKVTIVPRTSLALGFAQYSPSEQHLYSKEELFDKMCMALGGRAAEELVFRQITTGAQNDLDKVTKIAYSQIKKFGMNEKLGPMCITENNENNEFPTPFSKAMVNIVDIEARNLIAASYSKTKLILENNMEKLEKLAENLLEKETLNYDEIVNLIGPPFSGKLRRIIEPVEFEQSIKNLSEKQSSK